MIDLEYDYNVPKHKVCECGDPECLGSTHVVAAVVQELPVLRSPILRLVKERNAARRLCAVLAAAMPDFKLCIESLKARDNANAEMHEALMAFVKMSKNWDERSYAIGGEQ